MKYRGAMRFRKRFFARGQNRTDVAQAYAFTVGREIVLPRLTAFALVSKPFGFDTGSAMASSTPLGRSRDRCVKPKPAIPSTDSNPISPCRTGHFGKDQSGTGFEKVAAKSIEASDCDLTYLAGLRLREEVASACHIIRAR